MISELGAERLKSRQSHEWRLDSLNILFLFALATDLLTPLLIWKGVLPASTRWLSHAAIASMMALVFLRMMTMNRIPRAVWIIASASAVGLVVALLQGQGFVASAWGWWILFQFPIVGLFAYLQPKWPDRFPEKFRAACLWILALQVVVQLGQYAAGQRPGDDLAGLFGWHGTSYLVLFALFVVSLGLGQWVASGRWRFAVAALVLGGASSALGGNEILSFRCARPRISRSRAISH